MSEPTLDNTFKAGLLSDEQVTQWEADLQTAHAANLPLNALSVVRVVALNFGSEQLASLAGVALALVADRRALLARIAALETALGDARLEVAIQSTDVAKLPDVGHA